MRWTKCALRCLAALGGITLAASMTSQHASASLIGGAPTLTAVSLTNGTWSPGPSYLSLPTSGLSIASATTGQGNTTPAGAGTQTAISETFTPGSGPAFGAPNASGFTLGKIGVIAGGGAGSNPVTMHLYSVSPAPSASAYAS
jgi:hypothetical protein